MKKMLIILVSVVLVVMNLSLDISYSLTIKGVDTTGEGCLSFLKLNGTSNEVSVRHGEVLSIGGKSSGKFSFKGEGSGWLEIPVKSKPHVQVSVKKVAAMKAEPAMLYVLAIVQRRDSSLDLLTAEIPVMFPGQFPEGYKNDVQWWGNISKDELHATLPDGTARLLTMDLDIGNTCGLACPHCFRRDKRFDLANNPLAHEEIVSYVKEAKALGLKQVKILGRGEPFQNARFLEFLEEMTDLDIGVAVFSKGHVLGCDELARQYNGHRGIHTGWELVQRIQELKVSVLLGFNSFNCEMQESFTGVDRFSETALLKNYVNFRDQALINLVKAGFNEYIPGEATRLAMIAAPVKPENLDEIFDLYTWARSRNIYMLTCPTTESGKGKNELERLQEFSDYIPRLESLWAQIYIWAIKKGLIPLETFKKDGVSLYPGCHVCNQTAAGFYLNLSGQVNLCPGRVDDSTRFSLDIRHEKSLRDVWVQSSNYIRAKYGKQYNYHCVARDGHSLPRDFYKNIEARVKFS